MQFPDFLDAITSPDLRAVAAHWATARGERVMPAWEDIRPASIAAQLKQIWAYKSDPETGRFVARLAGDKIVRGLRHSFRGVQLEDLHPAAAVPLIHRTMTRVVQEPALYHLKGILFRQKDRTGTGERIMLPLADGGLLGVSALDSPGDPDYGQVELLSEGENWFRLSPLAAVA